MAPSNQEFAQWTGTYSDSDVVVGEPAEEGIKFLFDNPGVTITIFDDSFE